MPWLGIVLAGSCPSGELSCHGGELTYIVESCLPWRELSGGELSEWGVVMVGIASRWELSSGESS